MRIEIVDDLFDKIKRDNEKVREGKVVYMEKILVMTKDTFEKMPADRLKDLIREDIDENLN